MKRKLGTGQDRQVKWLCCISQIPRGNGFEKPARLWEMVSDRFRLAFRLNPNVGAWCIHGWCASIPYGNCVDLNESWKCRIGSGLEKV